MVQRSPAALGALLLLLAGAASAAETPTVLPGARDADDSGAAAIPEHFDSREEFYGCADNVLDQAHCGSCWAVSAAGTLADRYCVHAHKQFGFIGAAPLALSPQPLLSCASTAVVDATPYDSMGCNGGYQAEAWRFLQATGTADMSADQTGGCRPYWSSKCSPDPSGDGCLPCAAINECIDTGEAPTRYRVASSGAVVGSAHEMDAQVAAVQRELMRNGPVQACFDVYDNFFDFFDAQPTGTYNSSAGQDPVGGHCVKIIGWGATHAESMPYWLIANSWGEGWAQKGVFRYIRGANLGGMDTAVWAGCPEGTMCELTPSVVPAKDAPAAARRSGGRWHAAPLAVLRATAGGDNAPKASSGGHVSRAVAAVARHLELGAASRAGVRAEVDEDTRGALLSALRDDDDTIACVHTQVVAGLRTRLVLRAGPPHARRHAVATTLLAPRGPVRGVRAAHAIESLTTVDAADADALCFGAAASAVTERMAATQAFDAASTVAPL